MRRGGDRFVLRRYSPALTIGGGRVLNPHPAKHRRFEPALLAHLQALASDDLPEVVECWLRYADDRLKSQQVLAGEMGIGVERLTRLTAALVAAGRAMHVVSEGQPHVLHLDVCEQWGAQIEAALTSFHRVQSLRLGLPREELRNLSARYIQPELFDCVLRYLEEAGRIALDGAVVRAASHSIRFTPEQEVLKAAVEARLNTEDFADLPTMAELAQSLDAPLPQVTDMVQALQALGVVVALEGGLADPWRGPRPRADATERFSQARRRDYSSRIPHADWQQPQKRHGAFGPLRRRGTDDAAG